MGELALDVVADRQVLEQVVGELALVEPVRLPVVDVADAEALGVDLLSHWSCSSSSSVGVRATLMWQVFFSIRVARPRARARQRFSVGPSSTRISAIRRSSATRSWLFSALAAAESISLAMSRAAPRGEKLSSVARLARPACRGPGRRPGAPCAARRARSGPSRARSAPRARCRRLAAISCLASLLAVPEWARKVRVGANSPSLWPTIDSETNTGTCLRPSWTAIVWPTISGKTVEVRDQVLTICLSPDSFIASMRRIRRSSTNGPFFVERPIAALTSSSCRAGGRGRSARRSCLPFLRVR